MTKGDIAFRLSKLLPGIDPDLIDGWIHDRYTEILDRIKWKRREKSSMLVTVAPYETGTVTLTAGSTAVTGTGTVWTSSHTGRRFRVPHRNEFYTFTYVSATSGTLDRAFEGDTEADASYSLYQTIYALPSNCRILGKVSSFVSGVPLREERFLNDATVGPSIAFRKTVDDASDPPRMQIELYPIPDAVYSLPIEYTAEETSFTGEDTSVSLLPWMRPNCLIVGVQADGLAHQEDYAGADRKELRFESLLSTMVRTEAGNRPAKAIQVSTRFQSTLDPYGLAARRQQMP